MRSYQISHGYKESVEAITDDDRFAIKHTRGRKKGLPTILNEAEARKLRDALNEWLDYTSIKRGLAESAQGLAKSRGSFAKYAEEGNDAD